MASDFRVRLINPSTLQIGTRDFSGFPEAEVAYADTCKEVRENRMSAGWVGPVKAMLISPSGFLVRAFGCNF
jgi:hypothetical protein